LIVQKEQETKMYPALLSLPKTPISELVYEDVKIQIVHLKEWLLNL